MSVAHGLRPRWQSNQDETMATWSERNALTDESIQQIRKI